MTSPADPAPAVADLRWVCAAGLERGGHLLTAGELVVVRAILALQGDAALLYARLTARVHDAYPLGGLAGPGLTDVAGAVADLSRAGLVDQLVPWAARARLLPRAALVEGCRRLGRPTSGPREALVERLRDATHWHPEPWIRTRHRGLVRRLERWAFLRCHPDRSALVVERLGHVRWPSYRLTPGGAAQRTRRELLGWEELLDPELGSERALDLVARGHHLAPGRLSQASAWRGRLVERARALERLGELEPALRLYERIAELLDDAGEAAVRRAMVLERLGRPLEGLELLVRTRSRAAPEHGPAVARTARRLARRARTAWRPDPPLRPPHRRLVPLEPGDRAGHRPRYRVGAETHPVERAVMTRLTLAGRAAIHGEGALWTTLFALLFADCYFLEVPGALPVRHLSGPLDLGTPAFAARRREAVDAVLARVRAGEAPGLVREAGRRLFGCALAGASWGLADPDGLAAAAEGVGPGALAAALEVLLAHGWGAARGLPDLLVLPGPAVRIDGFLPSRLDSRAILVEIKGPGDTVRDAQSVWFDRLLRADAQVELWDVSPRVRPGPATEARSEPG